MISINTQPIDKTTFPDGTHLFRCTGWKLTKKAQLLDSNEANINWQYDNDSELFELKCVVDYLRNNGITKINLYMPYVPNARMDRIKNRDEMFTLKSFADLINNMHFANVFVLDIHSNVGAALINNITVISPKENIKTIINKHLPIKPTTMFFPDEGAMKRYSDIAKQLQFPFALGMKERDWRTGEIKGLQVLGKANYICNCNILIIDDICSKGSTFYHSAKALKGLGAKDISLYVSHLENAVHNGEMIQSGLISHIYTTDSIYRPELAPKNTTVPITIVNK